MRGKKSGLNSGLRKILAKIAKEFDYPRVVAVRCHIEVGVRPLKAPVDVTVESLSLPTTTTKSLTTSFPIDVRDEALEEAECHTVQRMSDIEAEVDTITCFDAFTTEIVSTQIAFSDPEVLAPEVRIAQAEQKSMTFDFDEPGLKTTPLIPVPRVRGGALLARTMPFHLKVRPFRGLNMKLVIRFRAAVLKQLNLSPAQVKFIGVVRNLPKAPLSVLKYEPGTGDQPDQVLLRLRGHTNPHFGKRAWVFVQLKGKDQYLPVTVKDEDA